jgi:2-furoate---CoA ligase
VPDAQWGEVVWVVIVATGEGAAPSLDDLLAHCGDRLAKFKRPRRFVFVEAVPKSPVGKLLRRHLVAGNYTEEKNSSDQKS